MCHIHRLSTDGFPVYEGQFGDFKKCHTTSLVYYLVLYYSMATVLGLGKSGPDMENILKDAVL